MAVMLWRKYITKQSVANYAAPILVLQLADTNWTIAQNVLVGWYGEVFIAPF